MQDAVGRQDGPMLREPKFVEFFHVTPDFLCLRSARERVRLPLGGMVDPRRLHRFARRMAVRGRMVQLARMGYDRIYACEGIATARASGDETLRADAARLFPLFARNPPP